MNLTPHRNHRRAAWRSCMAACRAPGFTLIELLVVIAIIAILASMLVPTIRSATLRSQMNSARVEMGSIAAAIGQYRAEYSQPPMSLQAMKAPIALADFTFGTVHRNADGTDETLTNRNGDPLPEISHSFSYKASNAEVMGILANLERFQNGEPTANAGFARNPRRMGFYDASRLDERGVARDPWGNPYIISFDVNSDGRTFDGFYWSPAVSGGNQIGLFNAPPATSASGVTEWSDFFYFPGPMMIWSLGPDGKAARMPAQEGVNKDNVLAWMN